jgi:DUF4097 and DUF4098 domain-containing protein YvlB
MRSLLIRITPLLAVLPALSGCFLEEAALAAHDRLEETRSFEPGGTFRLENINGSVTVETWEQDQVRIEAEKSATSDRSLDAIKIEIDGEGDLVEVRTRVPRRRSIFGSIGKVDYLIRLPAQARVEVETVNGKLYIEGIAGRVRASTVNGTVEIQDLSGEAEASTVNGGIEASYREADPDGRHHFSTTNGGVRLTLPPNVSGRFEASTVNGSIRTDFPLEVHGRFGGRRLDGRLGEGRGSFDINTVNGSVTIDKS